MVDFELVKLRCVVRGWDVTVTPGTSIHVITTPEGWFCIDGVGHIPFLRSEVDEEEVPDNAILLLSPRLTRETLCEAIEAGWMCRGWKCTDKHHQPHEFSWNGSGNDAHLGAWVCLYSNGAIEVETIEQGLTPVEQLAVHQAVSDLMIRLVEVKS